MLKETKILNNEYEKKFDTLSIKNIKTYMINHNLSLVYMSEGKLDDYKSIKELLVRYQKAEMMRIYTWDITKTFSDNQNNIAEFHRDIKETMIIEKRKKKYMKEVFSPLTFQKLNEDFFSLKYRFIGNLSQIAIEEFLYNINADLGEINLKTLNIKIEDIKEVYFYDGDDSYIFKIKNKIYKFYSEGGTGQGEGTVCYQDTNIKTFGNKRFNFYHEEFEEFLPNLKKEEEKYLNNLNHFLFDQEKRNIIVLTEKESEYEGIKNSLYQLAKFELELSNSIYESLFEIAIETEKESLIKSSNFNIELLQIVETDYVISYNYAVILVEEILYIIFWDNY